jgi:ABC-type microcin C transport system permease subunit YejB
MLPLLLVVLLAVGLYWSLLPLVHLATPLFELGWLGWLVLAGIVWLFAGP